MNVIEIFKAGRHTAQSGDTVELTEEDLLACAGGYDPRLSEAPVVVGHPESNAPAYGWVKSLKVENGALLAEFSQLDPEFQDLAEKGRYKKISASFYSPGSKDNPKPGVWYLRHVGFLGAQPPAVKGLKPVAFSGSLEGVVSFQSPVDGWASLARLLRSLRELIAERFGPGAAEKALPEFEVSSLGSLTADANPEEKGAGGQTTLSAKAEADKAPPQASGSSAVSFQERLILVESGAFVEGLVREGKVLPRDKAFLTAFLAGIPSGGVVEFSEGDEIVSKKMMAAFKDFLSGLPATVDFSERSSGAGLHGHGDYAELGGKIARAAVKNIHD